MATIQKRKSGSFAVLVYDASVKRKVYVGTYKKRIDAVRAVRELEDPFIEKTCKGCGKRFSTTDRKQARCRYRCSMAPDEDFPIADHWVYYCHDAVGALLYVGLTSEGLQRHRAHARTASWWAKVDTIRVRHYPTRAEASAAEAAAIREYKPPHNVALLPRRRNAPTD